MQQAVEETLRTIEARARLYRRLVQAVVAVAAALIATAIWTSLAVLLYAPAVGVLVMAVWVWADSAQVNRWRIRLARSGVAPDTLAKTLAERKDIPQRTWTGMLRSLRDPRQSGYRILLASLGLATALACGARAVQVRSLGWGALASGVLVLLAISRIRGPEPIK